MGSTAPYDVALLKFCYTDIGGGSKDSSAQRLFERYQQAMAGVQEQQPNLKLLHTTMPLRAQHDIDRIFPRLRWDHLPQSRRAPVADDTAVAREQRRTLTRV